MPSQIVFQEFSKRIKKNLYNRKATHITTPPYHDRSPLLATSFQLKIDTIYSSFRDILKKHSHILYFSLLYGTIYTYRGIAMGTRQFRVPDEWYTETIIA